MRQANVPTLERRSDDRTCAFALRRYNHVLSGNETEGLTMKYRAVPNSDLTVSEVGFGVWTLSAGWWGDYTDAEAASLLNRALDRGVNFFDTADTYGSGKGETILAKAFETRQDEIVVGTKFGYDIYAYGDGPRGQRELPQNWTPDYIRYACEQSLKRLGRSAIDLYQAHNLKADSVMNDDIYDTLERLKEEGKIRSYGAALGPSNGWLVEGSAVLRRRRLNSIQIIHNLFEQYPGKRLAEEAAEAGTGVLVRVPHSSGLLEGRYTENTVFDKNDHRRHRPRSWLINGLKKLETVRFLTENRNGATIGQMALKWLLADPNVMSTLPNIYNAEQIEEFAAVSDQEDVSAEELSALETLYAKNFGVDEQPMKFKGVEENSEEARALLEISAAEQPAASASGIAS